MGGKTNSIYPVLKNYGKRHAAYRLIKG